MSSMIYGGAWVISGVEYGRCFSQSAPFLTRKKIIFRDIARENFPGETPGAIWLSKYCQILRSILNFMISHPGVGKATAQDLLRRYRWNFARWRILKCRNGLWRKFLFGHLTPPRIKTISQNLSRQNVKDCKIVTLKI